MAGLYIHIPFCKKACHYCNFHFSTNQKYKSDFLEALCKELDIRSIELNDNILESIYFGGGTPSLLSYEDITTILNVIYDNYKVDTNVEITLEANPDDLNPKKVKQLSLTKINRLSIGVQSFFEDDLKEMNRAHNSIEAKRSIEISTKYFDNVSIDLMYGMPKMSNNKWQENLNIAFDYNLKHLSCYSITVEPKTTLEYFIKTKKYPALNDNLAAEHFEILVGKTAKAGFTHYEVCSFGKPGYFSKHNTNYWFGKSYLGVGPSAHSFDGKRRSWNISNNINYINSIKNDKLPSTQEILTQNNCFNEYLMTGLRTMWGVSLREVEMKFGIDYKLHLLKNSKRQINNRSLFLDNNCLKTTEKGKFLCDGIASDLFIL